MAETCVRRIGGVFQEKATRTLGEKEKVIDGFIINRAIRQVENEWLKKSTQFGALMRKRRLIEFDNKELSIRRQCELVGLQRSNLYYRD